MNEVKRRACSKKTLLICVCLWSMIVGILLYDIVSTPDAGGIWDGYVPTWLGGDGPTEAVQ